MKRKIISCIFFLLLVLLFSNPVLAKYVIEDSSVIATIQIDRTNPKVEVIYSIKEPTNQNVEVVLKANENVQELEGWVLQEDKKTLKKEYTQNTEEILELKDLAGNTTEVTVKITNIDNTGPIITIDKIKNDNFYLSYANKTNTITATITIKDDKKIANILQEKDIKILVDNKEITPKEKTLKTTKDEEKEKVFLLTLSGIEEEGNLVIKIPDEIISDEAQNKNKEVEKDTEIEIDNTSPQATFSEKQIAEGKVEAMITANEGIVKLDGWSRLNKNTLKNTFTNNVSYFVTIKDFAGNKTQVEINITQATYIVLSYASHNSEIGWSYGYGNYDIAGIEAAKLRLQYKTESLAFHISGNIENNFMEARAYTYTYWKEGSYGICNESKNLYPYGWSNWKSLNSEDNISLEGKKYFSFGGVGINLTNNTDSNGNNPIPIDIAGEHRYGISAIQLKLKNYDVYSIIYQIYVDEVGWVKPAKNGEVECYKEDKPISAIRIALVPNSELNSILETWNKDTRKIY